MHAHHVEDHAGTEAAGAASWMVAMFAVIVAAALLFALLLWEPWHSSGITNSGSNSGPVGTQSSQQQSNQSAPQNPDQPNVNVSGNDINVGGAGQSPSH